ncbi:MAG: TonB-dependent receptor [Gemmatimonadales bacterium]|nr:MAG: TonB-dependent receptor [Gemmatimonadales bacterium]
MCSPRMSCQNSLFEALPSSPKEVTQPTKPVVDSMHPDGARRQSARPVPRARPGGLSSDLARSCTLSAGGGVMISHVRILWTPSLILALAIPGPAGALADAPTDPGGESFQGTITGQVVDRSNRRPLAGAQVMIPALEMGTVTNAEGTFRLGNVPAGTHQLAVQFIGYERVTQQIDVASGETLTLNLQMVSRAIALDEVVVTSSPAGEARRRALGTNVASVNVEQALRDAPITSLNDILQAREPGVVNMSSSGSTGTAGLNILRGITSLTQDNQPLIYIDGIRMDRSNRSEIATGGQTLSRLNDINPQDIARIEVIKGSAATAMYGSEASSGVIQIFTKQGTPGEVVYEAGVRLGANQIPKNLPLQHPDPQYPSANDFLSTGLYQEFNASVRGATEHLSYFVSGSHMDNEGSFINNFQTRSTGRGNMVFRPTETFDGMLSSSFSRQRTRLSTNDNVTTGILTNVYLGNPLTRGTAYDPYGSAFQTVWREIERERYDFNTRYTAGLTLNHRPGGGFSHRLALGLDYISAGGSQLTPWYEDPGRAPFQGGKSENRRITLNTNIDYGASFTRPLSDRYEARISAGGQFYTQDMNNTSAAGTNFIAPPLKSIGGTETRGAGENELRYTTGGLFSELQLGYQDRLFFTVGFRADGSSAFGEDFGFSTFPKASVSYVISDESWFDYRHISTLRLRSGWGTAGTQPGAFDKLRLWGTTQGMDGMMGFRPTRQGNPDLGPEVSTEIEGGFDAGLFEDRVSVEFTAYSQRTDDILVSFQFPVSTGILANQLRNAGTVRNRGFEVGTTVSLVETPTLAWRMNAGYAYNSNEVLNMAGTPRQIVDRFGTQIVEGYPIAGKWEQVIVGHDEQGMPIASDTAVYLGPSIPPHTGNLGSDLSLRSLTIRATGQFAMGHVVNNHLRPYMAINRVGVDYYNVLEAAGGDPDHPDVTRFMAEQGIYGENIEDADWLKLRELSASYALPTSLSQRMGASSVRLTAAGRNLLTFSRYSGADPEVSATFSSGNNLSIGADFFTVPPSRQFVFGINMTF